MFHMQSNAVSEDFSRPDDDESHDPEHAIYFNHDFSLVEVILYVLATVWFDEASEIGYSFRQKKKKERKKTKKKGRNTKSNQIWRSFQLSFSWKVTITAHFLQPYQPNRNQWKIDILVTYIYFL